jgi:hypothetical protein
MQKQSFIYSVHVCSWSVTVFICVAIKWNTISGLCTATRLYYIQQQKKYDHTRARTHARARTHTHTHTHTHTQMLPQNEWWCLQSPLQSSTIIITCTGRIMYKQFIMTDDDDYQCCDIMWTQYTNIFKKHTASKYTGIYLCAHTVHNPKYQHLQCRKNLKLDSNSKSTSTAHNHCWPHHYGGTWCSKLLLLQNNNITANSFFEKTRTTTRNATRSGAKIAGTALPLSHQTYKAHFFCKELHSI